MTVISRCPWPFQCRKVLAKQTISQRGWLLEVRPSKINPHFWRGLGDEEGVACGLFFHSPWVLIIAPSDTFTQWFIVTNCPSIFLQGHGMPSERKRWHNSHEDMYAFRDSSAYEKCKESNTVYSQRLCQEWAITLQDKNMNPHSITSVLLSRFKSWKISKYEKNPQHFRKCKSCHKLRIEE